MDKNFYADAMGAENSLCVPAIPALAIRAIPGMVEKEVGGGTRPTVILDLEQVQVCDYAAFERLTDTHRTFIHDANSRAPIRADEMVFLALRSMFTFVWPEPTSTDDIIRAAAFERALNGILTSAALHYGNELSKQHPPLPYWGRLAFLRVMARLPEGHAAAYGLDKVACLLVKRPAFNATTFSLADANSVIGLNYALEPILKNLNRHLLHFRHTEHMAGPTRMWRAWKALLPTVQYFWGNSPANLLLTDCTFYDQKVVQEAHALTTSQLDFIIMHELGHVVLDHPKRYKALKDAGGDVTPIRHEFEYGADSFGFGLVRSNVLNNMRYFMTPNRNKAAGEADDNGIKELQSFLFDYEAIVLLFEYMAFIDTAGRQLKQRLGDAIGFRERLDSHPTARDRIARLESQRLGDVPYRTKNLDYARTFFENILKYIATLPDTDLLEPPSGREAASS